jgi:glycosyltransferase involved in cell wall biosynthesis
MKIAYVNTFYEPHRAGGAEVSVRLLASAVREWGDDPFVVTLGESYREYEVDGVRVFSLKPANVCSIFRPWKSLSPLWHLMDSFNPFMGYKVGRILDRERPEIVHTNNLKGFSVSIWNEARKRGLPLVHTLRDYYLLCPRGTMFGKGNNCDAPCRVCSLYSRKRRALSAHVDAVVGVSRFILRRHLAHGCFPCVRSHVVHNSSPRPAPCSPLPGMDGSLVVGFLGRLDRHKGVELLLREFHSLPQGRPTLLIGGTGDRDYEEELRSRFASASVVFEGFVSPEDILRRVDVVVIPSLWHEPLSRVVFEAYSHGLPVIASRRGGLPEIVDEGTTGLLFDPDVPGSLARAIGEVTSRDRLQRMREEAARKYEEFAPGRIAESYREIYRSVAR